MSVRTENAAKASAWLASIEKSKTFKSYIENAIEKTCIRYGDDIYTDSTKSYLNEKVAESKQKAFIDLLPYTTGDALFDMEYDSKRIAVLNFSSYFNPGGGFLKGAITQEESLCHISGLYNVLSSLDIYKERKEQDRKIPPEYGDEIIYSPGVPFVQGYDTSNKPMLVDVVTCSAPNCNRVPIAHSDSYRKAIDRRALGIYIEPYLQGCDVLILGAWGCGVFKNDPALIASVFKELNDKFGCLYSKVVYAIPNKQVYKIFENVFE